MLGVALGPPHPLQVLLAVGGPFQEGGQGPRDVGGPVDVRCQADSVPGGDHDVSFDPQGHGQPQSSSRSNSTMGMDRELTARSTDPRSLNPWPVTMQTARLEAGHRSPRPGLQVTGVGGGPGGLAVDSSREQRLLGREDLLVTHRLAAASRFKHGVQSELGVDDVGDLETRDDRGAFHLLRLELAPVQGPGDGGAASGLHGVHPGQPRNPALAEIVVEPSGDGRQQAPSPDGHEDVVDLVQDRRQSRRRCS